MGNGLFISMLFLQKIEATVFFQLPYKKQPDY